MTRYEQRGNEVVRVASNAADVSGHYVVTVSAPVVVASCTTPEAASAALRLLRGET